MFVVISKMVDSGVDVCPHEWEFIRERHGIRVFRCKVSGCLNFRSLSKAGSAIDKFIGFLKELPKILVKLPLKGGFYSDEEMGRRLKQDPRTIRMYFEVVEGLDLDGVPAYIQADSRIFIYRDDDTPQSSSNSPPFSGSVDNDKITLPHIELPKIGPLRPVGILPSLTLENPVTILDEWSKRIDTMCKRMDGALSK